MCKPPRLLVRTTHLAVVAMLLGGRAPHAIAQARPLSAASAPTREAATEPTREAAARASQHLVRIQRLDRRRDALKIARDSARAAVEHRLFPRELRVGLFRVATSPDLQDAILPVVHEFSRELQPHLDEETRNALLTWTVTVRRVDRGERRFSGFSPLLIAIHRGDNYLIAEDGTAFFEMSALRDRLRQLVVLATNRMFDESLHQWLFTAAISPFAPSAKVEHEARLELATADSRAAQRCVGGDLPECASLLAIHGLPTDPLHRWFAPEDYRALASHLRLESADGPYAPRLQRSCVAGRIPDCERLLTSVAPRRIPAPIQANARYLLLAEAVRLGGDSALSRLRVSTGDIGARLANASGVSEDSLLTSWQRRMVVAHAAPVRPPASIAIATVGWMALLSAFTFRRVRRCA